LNELTLKNTSGINVNSIIYKKDQEDGRIGSPYSQVNKDELILRDHLAADRTALANERTFLAYVRTAFTMFIAGVTFLHLFHSMISIIIGWVLVPVGIVIMFVGLVRYRTMKKLISQVQADAEK
jgi:inner membrane protein YidH